MYLTAQVSQAFTLLPCAKNEDLCDLRVISSHSLALWTRRKPGSFDRVNDRGEQKFGDEMMSQNQHGRTANRRYRRFVAWQAKTFDTQLSILYLDRKTIANSS